MSIIGELLLWTPPVPRDTFLEENIIALVFAIVGVGSSFGGGKRLMFEANRLVPGLVVVVVCWVAMLIIVMLLLFLICLLYTSPSPRDQRGSRMPSSA